MRGETSQSPQEAAVPTFGNAVIEDCYKKSLSLYDYSHFSVNMVE
jgi:hypothetical protein